MAVAIILGFAELAILAYFCYSAWVDPSDHIRPD